jgi:hypothetical protein
VTLFERKIAYEDDVRKVLKGLGYQSFDSMPRGVIAGYVDVTDCLETWRMTDPSGEYLELREDPLDNAFEAQVGWWSVMDWAWCLKHPHTWSVTPTYRGQQGLFDVPDKAVGAFLALQPRGQRNFFMGRPTTSGVAEATEPATA